MLLVFKKPWLIEATPRVTITNITANEPNSCGWRNGSRLYRGRVFVNLHLKITGFPLVSVGTHDENNWRKIHHVFDFFFN